MQQTAVSTEQAGRARWEAIPLGFEEGQEVILLAGAKVKGLITRCNQPGKVIHIQYSDEFGVTYVVAFGKLGMVAYVSADGLEAVADLPPNLAEGAKGETREIVAEKVGKFASKPAERVSLATPIVIVTGGVEGVISGHSTCDCQRYCVSYFDRHFWAVRHVWVARSQFEVVPQNETAFV